MFQFRLTVKSLVSRPEWHDNQCHIVLVTYLANWSHDDINCNVTKLTYHQNRRSINQPSREGRRIETASYCNRPWTWKCRTMLPERHVLLCKEILKHSNNSLQHNLQRIGGPSLEPHRKLLMQTRLRLDSVVGCEVVEPWNSSFQFILLLLWKPLFYFIWLLPRIPLFHFLAPSMKTIISIYLAPPMISIISIY